VAVVSKRALLHSLFAFMLLLAQHGALTHSIWHLGDRGRGAVETEAEPRHHANRNTGGKSGQSKLCDLHFLLGSVLAGDCAGQGASPDTVLAALPPAEAATRPGARSSPTPPSRAPPFSSDA
jgi:hypothetical protein